MSELKPYQSKVKYWQNQINRCQDNIAYWQRRHRDVQEIIDCLLSVVDRNTHDVNKRMIKTKNALADGLGWPDKSSLIHELFAQKNEKPIGSDRNMTSAETKLQQELNMIDQKIADTGIELKQANTKLKIAKSDLKEQESLL